MSLRFDQFAQQTFAYIQVRFAEQHKPDELDCGQAGCFSEDGGEGDVGGFFHRVAEDAG